MSGLRKRLRPLLVPVLAVLSAFIVGSLFLMLSDLKHLAMIPTDPIGALTGAMGDVINAYRALLLGAFGDPAKFALAFQQGTPKAWTSRVPNS